MATAGSEGLGARGTRTRHSAISHSMGPAFQSIVETAAGSYTMQSRVHSAEEATALSPGWRAFDLPSEVLFPWIHPAKPYVQAVLTAFDTLFKLRDYAAAERVGPTLHPAQRAIAPGRARAL